MHTGASNLENPWKTCICIDTHTVVVLELNYKNKNI